MPEAKRASGPAEFGQRLDDRGSDARDRQVPRRPATEVRRRCRSGSDAWQARSPAGAALASRDVPPRLPSRASTHSFRNTLTSIMIGRCTATMTIRNTVPRRRAPPASAGCRSARSWNRRPSRRRRCRRGVAPEDAPDHQVRQRPDEREGHEIGRPDAATATRHGGRPSPAFRRAEQRDRQREDELRQPVADGRRTAARCGPRRSRGRSGRRSTTTMISVSDNASAPRSPAGARRRRGLPAAARSAIEVGPAKAAGEAPHLAGSRGPWRGRS